MRKLMGLFTAFFVMLVVLVGCGRNRGYYSDDYRVINGPNGQKMVVVYDDEGREMLLDYATFQAAMNQGGYGSVMNYSNRFVPYTNNYRSWGYNNVPRTNYDYYRPEEPSINVTESQSNTGRSSYGSNVQESRSSLRTPSEYSTGRSGGSSLRTPSYSQPSSSSSSLRTPSSSPTRSYTSPSSSSSLRTPSYSSPSSSSSFRSPSSSSSSSGSSLRSPR